MDARPRPTATPETLPFWDGCREGKLLYQSCGACGASQFPPRAVCLSCRSETVGWKPSARRGTVHSATVVRRPPTPAFKNDVPYCLALIDLDEGFRLMMNVRGLPPEDVAIGHCVEIVFEDRGEGTVLPLAQIREGV